jgi:hypothetical protein
MPAPTATGRELTEQLSREFAATLPRTVVEAEVTTAERELHGQVPAGSVAELLHRLVMCRLRQRVQGAP